MTDLEFRELAEYLAFDWALRQLLKSEQTATAPNLRGRGSTPGEASTRLDASPGLLAPT